MIDVRANWTTEALKGPGLSVADLLPPSSRQELIPTLPGITPESSAAPYSAPYSSRPLAETQEYSSPVSQASPTFTPQGTLEDPRTEWCVDLGSILSTMDTFELWAAIDRGDVSASMRVWREGMECWTPVGQVSELALALNTASSRTPEPVTLHAVPSAPSFPELPAAPPPSDEVRPPLSTLVSGPRTSGWERLSQKILPPPSRSRARAHFWVAFGSAVSATAITAAVISAEPPRATSSFSESAAAAPQSAPSLGAAAAPQSAPSLGAAVPPSAPAPEPQAAEPEPPAAVAAPPPAATAATAPAPRASALRAAPPRPRYDERGQHRLRRSGKHPYGW